METENQRAGHGRSRGKWNRQKRKENEEKNRQSGLNENTQNQAAPNHAAQDSENQGQERKRAGRKIAVAVGGAVLTAAVAAGAVYVGMGQKYKRVYFPNTTINGLDVSGLTPEETKTKITEGTSGYILTLQERGGADEVICGSEIGLHPEFDGTL